MRQRRQTRIGPESTDSRHPGFGCHPRHVSAYQRNWHNRLRRDYYRSCGVGLSQCEAQTVSYGRWQVLEQQTVYGCGSLYIDDRLIDGPGMRVARDFATQLSYKFASHTRQFYETVRDLPFAYRERQVSASILQSMATVAEAVFAETPIRRGGSKEESHGWIDYWAIYRNATFVIELKHCYSAARGQKDVQVKVSDRLNEGIAQLRSVNPIRRCPVLRFRDRINYRLWRYRADFSHWTDCQHRAGFIGILFTGLLVAVAVRALQQAWADLHGTD
jgi:hypothetical protein